MEAYQNGTLDEMRKDLPEELIPEFDEHIWLINHRLDTEVHEVVQGFVDAKKNTENRKDFALFLKANYAKSLALRYAFTLLDHGDFVTDESLNALRTKILKTYKAVEFAVKEKVIEY